MLFGENMIFFLNGSLDVQTPGVGLQTSDLRCNILGKEELPGM